jgi:hypothetical protein
VRLLSVLGVAGRGGVRRELRAGVGADDDPAFARADRHMGAVELDYVFTR